ncbi:hypothetical protein [Saccharothrix xinjiangensis]|uniref:Uncharacterized protein n=1 Tax=Saccharothrix xinjiangensis TaxID=204798 RepID=A0ABV9XU00_9PSEU
MTRGYGTMATDTTHVSWLVVDENNREVEFPDDEPMLPDGGVQHVPATGDSVILAGRTWRVVHRIWALPLAAQEAVTPRQAVTLWIREQPLPVGEAR